MGNVITNEEEEIKPSVLKNVIDEWAKNDYDAGLNYGKEIPIKKLLLKRACCIKSPHMKIALPTYDAEHDIMEIGYTPVVIKNIYIEQNHATQCNLSNEEGDNSNYAQPPDYNNNQSTTAACQALYQGNKFGLCENVMIDRSKQLTSDRQIAYGRYPEDDALNVYSDCNCLTSVLRNSKAQAGNITYSASALAQTFDPKCSEPFNHAYNLKIEKIDAEICINSINSTGLTVDTSQLNISQNCGIIPQVNVLPAEKETVISKPDVINTASSVPTTTTTTKPTVNIFTSTNIIIFVSSLVVTIIFMMVFII
jgi:hypothetical protein